jgi:dephospho-CoA kinase
MLRLGLTGGIASGKTTVARQFSLCGIPCFDADRAVHWLQHHDERLRQKIAERFPEVVTTNGMDRAALGAMAFRDSEILLWLESIFHPAVRDMERRFESRMNRYHYPAVVIEIPLLFEVGAEHRFDTTLLASCPEWLQKQRAFSRPYMTEEKYCNITARQLPRPVKRKKADFEIFTGAGKAHSMRQVKTILSILTA